MRSKVSKAGFVLLLAALFLSPPLLFSKPKATMHTPALQGAEDGTLPIIFGRPQTGTVPAAPAGGCLLSPVQYRFTVPEGECEPVDLIYSLRLQANQSVKLYVRFAQRVAVEQGQVIADFAIDSGSATERRLEVSIISNPALRSGEYFVAISNCATGAANFTLALNGGFLDFIAPIRVISRAEVDGKRLLIYGCFPKKGATLFVNGVRQKHLLPDEERPRGLAIAKKAGAQIAPNQTVTIEFRYADGRPSNTLLFTRPPE